MPVVPVLPVFNQSAYAKVSFKNCTVTRNQIQQFYSDDLSFITREMMTGKGESREQEHS